MTKESFYSPQEDINENAMRLERWERIYFFVMSIVTWSAFAAAIALAAFAALRLIEIYELVMGGIQ